MNVNTATGRRRVVHRRARPCLDSAYDVALAKLPVEIRPLVLRYVENMQQGQEIRSELSTAMTRHGLRWHQVDNLAHSLLPNRA